MSISKVTNEYLFGSDSLVWLAMIMLHNLCNNREYTV